MVNNTNKKTLFSQQTIEELTQIAHERGNDIEIRSTKDGKIKVFEVQKTLIGVFESKK